MYLDDIHILKSTHNKEIEKLKMFFEKNLQNLRVYRKMIKGFLKTK